MQSPRRVSDSLGTYLQDHLAGTRGAIELLTQLRDRKSEGRLRAVATELLDELEQDQRTLQQFARSVGVDSNLWKEAAVWIGEKSSRWKLRHRSSEEFAVFEALETLSAGLLGKRNLWTALAVAAPANTRVHGLDFEGLSARAEAQFARIETLRLQYASKALAAPSARSEET